MRAKQSVILSLLLCLLSLACSDNPTAINYFSTYEWETSIPEEQGINSAQLNSALEEAEKRTHIFSIVVIKNGYLIGEKYFNSYNKNSAFNIRSVSKSFLSAMAGIALKENFIKSLDEKMLNFILSM